MRQLDDKGRNVFANIELYYYKITALKDLTVIISFVVDVYIADPFLSLYHHNHHACVGFIV